MQTNDRILKEILELGTPVLFLGAGFSYGSSNEYGMIPTGKILAQDIYNKFIKGSVSIEEAKEIETYNLQDICQITNELLEKKEELKEYLFKRFKNIVPEEFHYKLLNYPWKKIYTVNIDDLVENIYKKSNEKIVVQNTQKEKKVDQEIEFVKLHGCVYAQDEPIVFSKTEYTNLISNRNYKLDKLTSDIVSKNIIFIGASLDEQDIDYYITKYENAGFLQRGKLVFIDPYPSVKLKTRVKSLGGVLIEWTTEQFLDFVAELKYNPSEQIKAKKMLNYYGMHCYKDIMECFQGDNIYESSLYQGYGCKWEDVFFDWIINTKSIKKVSEIIEDLSFDTYDAFCVAIVGNCFTGKSCVLKQVASYLNKSGYEVIEYVGKALNQKSLINYIEKSLSQKIVLLIDNASFYYWIIEKLLQRKR